MFTFELLTKNSIVQIFFNIKMPRYISDYIPYALHLASYPLMDHIVTNGKIGINIDTCITSYLFISQWLCASISCVC